MSKVEELTPEERKRLEQIVRRYGTISLPGEPPMGLLVLIAAVKREFPQLSRAEIWAFAYRLLMGD